MIEKGNNQAGRGPASHLLRCAHRAGSSQGRHYRESLFWAVRSFESRSGHRAPPRGACDHGRPRAAPRQINARSWERHFQRRDAIFVIALLERLQHMSLILCERLQHMSHFREARR